MVNKDYPPRTILHRSDTGVYGVLVELEDAKRYVMTKGVTNEQFEMFAKTGAACSLAYFPALELKQKKQIPFCFIPPELPGYNKVDRETLRQRKRGLSLDQLAILNQVEEFLRFLESI